MHARAERESLTLRQACSQETPGSAMCVQSLDDSRGFAIRITYRISLRSSSLWEPRHPLLKVVGLYIQFYCPHRPHNTTLESNPIQSDPIQSSQLDSTRLHLTRLDSTRGCVCPSVRLHFTVLHVVLVKTSVDRPVRKRANSSPTPALSSFTTMRKAHCQNLLSQD